MAAQALRRYEEDVLAFLRICVGVFFVFHGSQKVFGFGIQGVAENVVAPLGFPMPTLFALLLVVAELVGGIGLILGLATRLWGLMIAIAMFVAAVLHHMPRDGFLWWETEMLSSTKTEYAFLLMVVGLLFLVRGGGTYSIDGKIFGGRL